VLAASREREKGSITFQPTDDTGIWIRGNESLAYKEHFIPYQVEDIKKNSGANESQRSRPFRRS
jgi:hypothetical protein